MSKVASVPVAKAGPVSVIRGTDAPSSQLDFYTMIPFADDLRPNYHECSYVMSPFGGNVVFDTSLMHFEIFDNWSNWSHGYTGDVYWTGENKHYITLTMPSETYAFYFYAQPNSLVISTITAAACDNADSIEYISQDVNGDSGASYFGFYCNDGGYIKTITIYSPATDFAIGEFGISLIPVPGAFLLSSIGISAVTELKRQRII